MTIEEAFEKTKQEIVGDDLTITSALEADQLHDLFIKLRTELFFRGITEIMPPDFIIFLKKTTINL